MKKLPHIDFNWPVFVLCGNMKQFENFKKETNLRIGRYISGPQSVIGIGQATVICYGTYFWRSDYDEINLILNNRPEITRIIYGTN